MNPDTEAVFATIKTIYSRTNTAIPVWMVYTTLKNIKQNVVRNSIIFLKNDHKINFDFSEGKVSPILSQDEQAFVDQRKTTLNEIKVKDCIKQFFLETANYPTPTDIAKTFFKRYGIVNTETITRFIRKMAEENKLDRTVDSRYYYKGLGQKNGGLMSFV